MLEVKERNKSIRNTTSTCSGSKEESNNKNSNNNNNNNNYNNKGKDNDHQVVEGDQFNGVGHGQLYSPAYALRVPLNIVPSTTTDSNSMGVLTEVKERLLEKLVAAAVPAEALMKARRLLETVVRDATVAAHALSKDALHRIKTHLVDILPSLSPALTTKMVDEAEKEVEAEAETDENKEESSSTNNNYQEANKPSSRL